MTTAPVIHGHFYQPPRENPWTELIDREPGAQPFHDWNERLHAECYRPKAFARLRYPYSPSELLWLPETAFDAATLETFIEEGLRPATLETKARDPNAAATQPAEANLAY